MTEFYNLSSSGNEIYQHIRNLDNGEAVFIKWGTVLTTEGAKYISRGIRRFPIAKMKRTIPDPEITFMN